MTARRRPSAKKPAAAKKKAPPAKAAPSPKVMSLDDLAAVAARLRKQGETVVLAHGVFDLLHFGHVRHLQAAKSEGSKLFVTLTADAYVNKGPDRPVFPERVRAEMLASLECVDYVGINHAPSAEPVLRAIRPDVYAKGREYADSGADVTGKIASESQVVEDAGGRVVFTDDVTFSSSSLLNKHFNIYDPILQQYLDRLRQDKTADRLSALFDKVKNMRVLVIGDAIVDEYQYVNPLGKAAKETIIATRFQSREIFAGGVVAAANHVATFCREVEVLTVLGDTDSHEELIRGSLKSNVRLTHLVRPGAPTTRKSRFIDHGYSLRKLFEVCFMEGSPLPDELTRRLNRLIAERAGDYDLVVVTDFGHGLIGHPTVQALCEKAKFLAVNTQTNSANYGFNLITKYPRADYICVDAPEARLAVGDNHADLIALVGDYLPFKIACDNIIVTNGKYGCYTFDPASGLAHLPALTRTIVDTIGAGDAFFAVSAPFVAAGASIQDAGFVGNAAGGLMVGIVGHRQSVEKAALVKFVTALLK